MKKKFLTGLVLAAGIAAMTACGSGDAADGTVKETTTAVAEESEDGAAEEAAEETTEQAADETADGAAEKAAEETAKQDADAEKSDDASGGDAGEAVSKSDEEGTAGSNIPLKDNLEEAEYQIQVAMQHQLEEMYGDKVFDARIYVDKVYTAEDEENEDAVKSMNLGPNEVAFVVRYELKPAPGVDYNELLIPNGEYDEESEWVKNKTSVGVLRPNEGGEPAYKITDFGTGF